MKNSFFSTKKLIQLRFKWYSLLTDLIGSNHFSKYKLKYGAMLLTLAVTGSCNNKNSNPKDSTIVSDSISEQQQPSCYEPSVPIEPADTIKLTPPPKTPVEKYPENPLFCYDPVYEPENKTEVELANKIYKAAETPPQYPGGNAELTKYIKDNLRYPEGAIKDSIQGRVVVQFVVHKTGKISDAKVLRSVHPSCDKEAIRLIELMPDWIPGEMDGKPVNVYFTLPIRFIIDKTN